MSRRAVGLLALLWFACDDPPGTTPANAPPADAGPIKLADGKLVKDAKLSQDASAPIDAIPSDGIPSDGIPSDAPSDGGCPRDGGDGGDAACPTDAAPPTDASTPIDASHPSDAACRADGGGDARCPGDGGYEAIDGPPGGGTDAPDAGGCPAVPSCGDTDPLMVSATNPQGYCRGMCDPLCLGEYWRWTFWVTQYNVGGTYGWGEHQGIGILGFLYQYDGRFAWDAPGAAMPPWREHGALWHVTMGVSEARQFEMRTTNPSGETQATTPESLANQPASFSAYCGHQPLLDTKIYNHGRTLAREVPLDGFYQGLDLIPMRALSVEDQCRTGNTYCRPPTPNQIGACMATITDGACDSRCGNCSYVAATQDVQQGSRFYYEDILVSPRSGLTVHGTRPEPAVQVQYAGGVTIGAGGAGAVDQPWAWFYERQGNTLRRTRRQTVAPFTHCWDTSTIFQPGSDNPMEWVLWADPLALTGRWGHNSNTDAELERALFVNCGQSPATASTESGLQASCAICGNARMAGGTTTQYPCRDYTCTAELDWDPTSGIHDIGDLGVGLWPGFTGSPYSSTNPAWRDQLRPMPNCRWGGFKVWGM